MTLIHQQMDFLPKVPEHFITRAKQFLEQEDKKPDVAYRNEELSNGVWFRPIDPDGSGNIIKGRSNILFPWPDQEFEQWVRDNITTNYKSIMLGMNLPGEDASVTQPAHTDLHRAWNLMHVFENSSDEQTTCFWQEDGYPLIRPLATYKSDFKNLTKVSEAKFKKNTWNAFSTCILHSVRNVVGGLHARMTIHLSLYEDPTVRPDFFTTATR